MFNSPTHQSQNLWMIVRMNFIQLKIYYYCCCYGKKYNITNKQKQKKKTKTKKKNERTNKNLRTKNKGYIC